MLVELQPHYLDLIVRAIEAAGHACLLQKRDECSGRIFVTATATSTRSLAVVSFAFGDDEVAVQVQFRDQRQPVQLMATYQDGLDAFWPKFAQALTGNRIEDKRRAA